MTTKKTKEWVVPVRVVKRGVVWVTAKTAQEALKLATEGMWDAEVIDELWDITGAPKENK